MRKNILLLLTAVLTLFISACGLDEDEEIAAGSSCSSEGSEICSDDGAYLFLCQDYKWTIEKQCNISIGKQCGQNSAGAFGCFGGNIEDYSDSDTSDQDTDEPDTNDSSDTENETPDGDTTSEDPADTDDTDSIPQTDSDNTDDQDDKVTDNDSDNDSVNDNDTDSDTDTDTDNDTTEPPAGQCSSNSDCSGATPYCSITTSECIANAIFITEYVEGSSENKAIEIYNGSKTAVNLSNFTIQQANNGKDWGSDANFIYSFTASTAIPSGQTFVFCNALADTELVAKCDQTPTSGVFKFNGNDGIALFDGSSIVDQIGISGDVEAWDAAGAASATQDHTLRRKTSVIQGTSFWTDSAGTTEANSEWIVLPQDTFDGLGIR